MFTLKKNYEYILKLSNQLNIPYEIKNVSKNIE